MDELYKDYYSLIKKKESLTQELNKSNKVTRDFFEKYQDELNHSFYLKLMLRDLKSEIQNLEDSINAV
jgi:hypothetical protein